MKVGLVDADLIDGGTRFPNLALLKIAGYFNGLGCDVQLIDGFDPTIDRVYCSKVFQKTKTPSFLSDYKNVVYGGTGFHLYNALPLPEEIERAFPYYKLYNSFIEARFDKRVARKSFNEYYTDSSIGFTTRGCIRRCPFCVNRNKTSVERWSRVPEFFDPSRKYVVLLDDNVLAYPRWEEVFDELTATERSCRFIQGLDVRLMTPRKARRLQELKYHRSVCFAFDNIADRASIERGLATYRADCARKQTLAYVLVGYYKRGEDELADAIERVEILTRYNVDPYIMKHDNYKLDPFANIYVELARWSNQPMFRKTTFGEFCQLTASKKARVQIETVPSALRSRLLELRRRQ